MSMGACLARIYLPKRRSRLGYGSYPALWFAAFAKVRCLMPYAFQLAFLARP